MKAIRHILVPVAFGAACDDAIARAMVLARAFGACVTVIHVYERALFGAGSHGSALESARLKQEAREALTAFIDRHRVPGVDLGGVLREGEPWIEILAEADVGKGDLIVMGTHGRTGVARALIASVAEKVVRHASVPVLTVRQATAFGAEASEAASDIGA